MASVREKIIQHIKKEYGSRAAGSLIPTIKELAESTNASITSVQLAVKKLKEEKWLVSVAGGGLYLNHFPTKKIQALGINYSEGKLEANQWGMGLYQGVLDVASYQEIPLMTFPKDYFLKMKYKEILLELKNQISGLIIMPGQYPGLDFNQFKKINLPYITSHPYQESATVDFICTDYFLTGNVLGSVWAELLKKRIAFIGFNNIPSKLRYYGLTNALVWGNKKDIELKHFILENEEGIDGIIESKEWKRFKPDAVFSTSDRVAKKIQQWALEMSISIPGELSIIGGMGYHVHADNPLKISVFTQPFRKMGELMAEALILKIQNNHLTVPGRYIKPGYCGYGTTTIEENERILSYINNKC